MCTTLVPVLYDNLRIVENVVGVQSPPQLRQEMEQFLTQHCVVSIIILLVIRGSLHIIKIPYLTDHQQVICC